MDRTGSGSFSVAYVGNNGVGNGLKTVHRRSRKSRVPKYKTVN
jgi:hypothetical protein